MNVRVVESQRAEVRRVGKSDLEIMIASHYEYQLAILLVLMDPYEGVDLHRKIDE
jgi:hypothetical protein